MEKEEPAKLIRSSHPTYHLLVRRDRRDDVDVKVFLCTRLDDGIC